MRVFRTGAAATALVAGVVGSALGLAGPAGATGGNVAVVGYSVIGPVFTTLEDAFAGTPAGEGVAFTNSFGSSDTETTDVANGQSADVVNLSYDGNMETLVQAGKLAPSWSHQEAAIAKVATSNTVFGDPGILTDSQVVFVVRKGNPLGISTWSDLVRPGVQIVTPDPLTSGSARWNLLGAYASQLDAKRTPHQAQTFLKEVLSHTVAQPSSGATSLAAFLAGTGNVLLAYESDALAAVKAGDPVEVVTPPTTFLIECPAALTLQGQKNPAARAFYRFLFSVAGQRILLDAGYRPVLKSLWNAAKGAFTSVPSSQLWSVSRLSPGGWSVVNNEFFATTVTFGKDKAFPTSGIVTYWEKYAGSAG